MSLKPNPRAHRSNTSGGRLTSRLDRTPYDREQERIRTEINTVQTRLVEVRNKITLLANGGPGAEKEATLRLEIDNLRNQQANSKTDRITKAGEISRLQEEVRKKVKDIQTMGRKLPAKSIVDLESQINAYEQRIEQGLLRFAEEKKAVNAISNLRRSRPAIESYMALSTSIAIDRNRLADLQKSMDAAPTDLSSNIEEVRSQLEVLRQERNEFYANRGALFSERDTLQKRLTELYEERQRSTKDFHAAQEAFRQMNEAERAKEADRLRAERKAVDEKRREEGRARLMERAQMPIFYSKKRDCHTLLEFFSPYAGGKAGKETVTSQPVASSPVSFHPQNEDSTSRYSGGQTWDQWVPMRKKSEKEEDFFMGSKKGKKGRRQATEGSMSSSYTATASKMTIPLPIMNLLMSFEIMPPSTTADVPHIVEAIQKKLDWLNGMCFLTSLLITVTLD
ncbi:hypothetical protein M422DRAFT_149540 [Sphaerobolus stellatus SS14]|nr:hypothetical protein M422DRAFT_149540 [Sphaerobolus stellatus SS14]